MAIKAKDMKLLWGRSASRCAICRVQLIQDAASIPSVFAIGEQAHIVGEQIGAARGDGKLAPEDRNSYHNLILLCPNHHTEIDRNEADWSIERLHLVKSKHELWVSETLSEQVDGAKLAVSATLSALVDAAVEKCNLENWKEWTSHALAPNSMWSSRLIRDVFEFRMIVIAAIWPAEFDELRRSLISFSILIHKAAGKFCEHCELREELYVADRFYRRPNHNPNYAGDVEEFERWQSECAELLFQATRAANWFADVVRRDLNPMFFAARGKFLVLYGPGEDLSFQVRLLEFTSEEKSALPDGLK